MQEGSNWRLRVVSSRKELPLCEGQEEEDEMGDGEGEEGERGEKGEKGEGEEGKKGVVGIAREFYHKEIRDYCLPDRDHVIFRYRDLPACRGLDLAPSVSPSLPPSLPPLPPSFLLSSSLSIQVFNEGITRLSHHGTATHFQERRIHQVGGRHASGHANLDDYLVWVLSA